MCEFKIPVNLNTSEYALLKITINYNTILFKHNGHHYYTHLIYIVMYTDQSYTPNIHLYTPNYT